MFFFGGKGAAVAGLAAELTTGAGAGLALDGSLGDSGLLGAFPKVTGAGAGLEVATGFAGAGGVAPAGGVGVVGLAEGVADLTSAGLTAAAGGVAAVAGLAGAAAGFATSTGFEGGVIMTAGFGWIIGVTAGLAGATFLAGS